MSVSLPSWFDGKIWNTTRPFDSLSMRSANSFARRFIGCVAGRLFAYL